CGFKAAYMSGAGISNSRGLPDIGILTRDEFARQAEYIANAVKIPVIADADTGFGGPSEVKKTVSAFEKTGVAGIQIEDQKTAAKRCGHLPGKEIISAKEMVKKIEAAYSARKNKDFLIIARTDAAGVNGFDDAVTRAKMYIDAGADIIFPEALESKTEFKRFAKAINAPLMANMTEFGKTPYITAREFEDMGYSIVIFPMTVFRVAMKSMENALFELKDRGTQKSLLKKMQTRKELYKLLKYKG
ncbi:MAG: isocitrate lyase/phosphoenolpyruvate mutase family protein, partial [Deltaproteobacteria bacterium]